MHYVYVSQFVKVTGCLILETLQLFRLSDQVDIAASRVWVEKCSFWFYGFLWSAADIFHPSWPNNVFLQS
jgi:hypothetical protein